MSKNSVKKVRFIPFCTIERMNYKNIPGLINIVKYTILLFSPPGVAFVVPIYPFSTLHCIYYKYKTILVQNAVEYLILMCDNA